MKIAIHKSGFGFSADWISYCQKKKIPHKIVNCYSNDIIQQLKDCNALMWHFSHIIPKDILVAKQILNALEHTGFKVFPDFKTCWHFDDKVAQKYLLEQIDAPAVKSYVFFDKHEATMWAKNTDYPKVFKLRKGASSQNVELIKSQKHAIRKIKKAFKNGFSNYKALDSLKERNRLFKIGKSNFWETIKGTLRFFIPLEYIRVLGKEIGYIYFQDFIRGNKFDTRIIVIDEKAYGMKRLIRKNDFRASGSNIFDYENINLQSVKIALDFAYKLKLQAVAFDFVFDNDKPLIVEMSYGFGTTGSGQCKGYWDKNLNWNEGKFNPFGWMVDIIIKSII